MAPQHEITITFAHAIDKNNHALEAQIKSPSSSGSVVAENEAASESWKEMAFVDSPDGKQSCSRLANITVALKKWNNFLHEGKIHKTKSTDEADDFFIMITTTHILGHDYNRHWQDLEQTLETHQEFEKVESLIQTRRARFEQWFDELGRDRRGLPFLKRQQELKDNMEKAAFLVGTATDEDFYSNLEETKRLVLANELEEMAAKACCHSSRSEDSLRYVIINVSLWLGVGLHRNEVIFSFSVLVHC